VLGYDAGRQSEPGTPMSKNRHVALLRGINVGGNNIIKMADLKRSFEAMGFSDVETYIASGNVIFSAKSAQKPKLVKTIEAGLDRAFGYASRVVVVSDDDLELVVAEAPAGFGDEPGKYRYDVLFVKAPLVAREALKEVPTKPGVDVAFAGKHALYFRRLISKASQSKLARVIQLPLYQNITIRNWNTTLKLLEKVGRKS
jgi:uncharacterized protein (DUF1697 family)